MGADIHLFHEKYDTKTSKWESCDNWQLNKYYNSEEDTYDIGIDSQNEMKYEVPYDNYIYRGRNYYLFGCLAGVRGNIPCISYPRGIPDGVNEWIKKYIDKYGVDGHSHSWYTLEELLDVNWEFYTKNDYENVSQFLKVIEYLKTIDSDPKNVRIIFFFDS